MSNELASANPMLVIHWGQNGGGPWFAVRMAEALHHAWPGPVYTSFNQNAEILALETTQIENDLPVTTYKTVAGLVLGLPRMILLGFKLRSFIKGNQVEVVYSAMLSIWQSLVTAIFLPKGVVFVASIHDAVEHPGDAHWVLRLCRYLDCRRADLLAVYSDSVAGILRQQKAARNTPIVVVPLGADRPVESPRTLDARAGEPLRLGFTGRIVEYKGLPLFVETVRLLRDGGMNVRGYVAGSGEVDPALIASSQEFVDWRLEWIPEAEIPQVFAQMDVLVLPYLEASQSGVFSLALSAGVPSVATPMGGLIEQITSTGAGVIAKSMTADSLAEAIRELADPPVYDRLSQRCLDVAAGEGSWESSAHVLVKSVLGPREGDEVMLQAGHKL